MIYVTRYNGFAFTNVYRYLRYYYYDTYTVLYKIINIYIYIFLVINVLVLGYRTRHAVVRSYSKVTIYLFF